MRMFFLPIRLLEFVKEWQRSRMLYIVIVREVVASWKVKSLYEI